MFSIVLDHKFLDDYQVVKELNSLFGQEFKNQELVDESLELKCAKEYAKDADVVIMALGEHSYQSGEAASRTDLSIPKPQMNLFKEIVKLKKPIVSLIFSGRPLILNEIKKYSDAVLQCWFPGIEGGNGIANILYGKVNPSARLSISFPYHVGQCPISYNFLNTGRPNTKEDIGNRFVSKYIDPQIYHCMVLDMGYLIVNLNIRKFL